MLIPNKSIGQNIAHRRKQLGLKQKDLAALTGLRYKYISDVETGRKTPEVPTLARIAAGLGVTMEELNGFEEGQDENESGSHPSPSPLRGEWHSSSTSDETRRQRD